MNASQEPIGSVSTSLHSATFAHARLYARTVARGAKLKLALLATIVTAGVTIAAVHAAIHAAGEVASEADVSASVIEGVRLTTYHLGIRLGIFGVLVYLLPFLFGSGAIGEQVSHRTISYLTSRPSSRSSIVLGRWLVASGLSALFLGATTMVVYLGVFANAPSALVDNLGGLGRTVAALTLLSSGYSALTLCFGALVPSAAGILGGLYLAVVEFFLAGIEACMFFVLTLKHHAIRVSGTAVLPENSDSIVDKIPVAASVLVLLLGIVLWLSLASAAMSYREYRT